MTLPVSGPLSASMIQGEFGGVPPISLSEYYSGGANVPAGTEGINGPIPTGGTISFSQFYGSTKFIPEDLILTSGLNGYLRGSFGTLVPDTVRGEQILLLLSGGGVTLNFDLTILPQYFFNSMTIVGGPTLNSVDATFTNPSGGSTWAWSDAFDFIISQVYTIQFR